LETIISKTLNIYKEISSITCGKKVAVRAFCAKTQREDGLERPSKVEVGEWLVRVLGSLAILVAKDVARVSVRD